MKLKWYRRRYKHFRLNGIEWTNGILTNKKKKRENFDEHLFINFVKFS